MPPFRNTDAMTRRILRESRTVAVVGASDKPHRDSYEITGLLIEHGYEVYPVNPRVAERSPPNNKIHGRTVYASLGEIPVEIDLVDIFRRSSAAGAVVDGAISIGAKSIWLQEGVIDNEAALRARSRGLDVAMNICPYHELARLGVQGPKDRKKKAADEQYGRGETRAASCAAATGSNRTFTRNRKRRKFSNQS